ncbi:MAG: response regulator [Firmicutes bacterium]|nr:response regulator [Bacillota bacterium]
MDNVSGNEKILVVDDDQAIVDSVWQYLRLVGFNSLKAHSGKECLEIVKSERPDLILLDLMMPEMDGFEVIEKIKQEKGLEHIPVIFVTAKTSEADQLKGWQKGASHYITKPFDMDELVSAIHLALYERKRQINQKIYEV